MAILFEELAGSPTVRFQDGSFAATHRMLVAWNQAIEFLVELYGGWRYVGGTELSITPPSHFPGVPQAFVTEVMIEPFPADNPHANPTITLESPTNAYDKGISARFLRNHIRPRQPLASRFAGGSQRHVPHLSGRIGTRIAFHARPELEVGHRLGLVRDDVRPTIVTPAEEFTLTWYRVPRPPWDAIRDLRGKVNSATFLNFAAGTVLFLGAETKRDFQVLDPGMWRLAYRFKVRTVPSTTERHPPWLESLVSSQRRLE